MNVSMLKNQVFELKCWLQICTKKAWMTTLYAKRLQLLSDFVPQTPTRFFIPAKLNNSKHQIFSIDFLWMWAIEYGLEQDT